MLLESFLYKFGQICETGMAPTWLKSILQKIWKDLRDSKCSYDSGINFMQVWTDLRDSKCSFASGNKFMPVWMDL